jgi:hypothetical protein
MTERRKDMREMPKEYLGGSGKEGWMDDIGTRQGEERMRIKAMRAREKRKGTKREKGE